MRTVNRNVISRIRAKESGKASKNTEVAYNDEDNISIVILFGKHIATYDHGERSLYCRDAGWQTVTTADRLNALLAEFAPAWRIIQRDWTWYIDNLAESEEGRETWPGEYTFR